jgi:branched-chain amino acid transport system ATP-binding protein
MTILRIEGLTKDFGGLRALENVTFDVEQGEILGLIGPNGSGKSTVLNVVTGFLPRTSGQVTFKGRCISGFKPHQIARNGLVRTFQLTSLFPGLTVIENIFRGRHLGSNSGFLESIFQTPGYRRQESRLRQEAMDVLRFVNLDQKGDMLASNLPAAEQRILEIAIGLSAKPDLLMLDEPAAGMNLSEAFRAMELIRSVRQKGTTVMIIDHNMKVIMQLCSRIIVLNQGVKIAEGTPQKINANQEVVDVYLGKRRDEHT